LFLALILGAVAAGLTVAYLAEARASAIAPTEVVARQSVVVVREAIPAGAVITSDMVQLRELPTEAVASGAVTRLADVVGETARYPLDAGEQVSRSRLVGSVSVQALSFQIPAGMRGFTIPVDSRQSPAALLAPGDFVDVLVAGSTEDLVTPSSVVSGPSVLVHGRLVTRDIPSLEAFAAAVLDPDSEDPTVIVDARQAVVTLLQNVQVLSVQRDYVANGVPYDSSVRGDPPKDAAVSYVTLALTPEQSQLLWLAAQEGQMTLALRSFGDDHVGEVGAVTTAGSDEVRR